MEPAGLPTIPDIPGAEAFLSSPPSVAWQAPHCCSKISLPITFTYEELEDLPTPASPSGTVTYEK